MNDRVIVRVKDVMKTGYDLVDGLDSVADALRNAQNPDTKCLLVKKRDDNDEYGIVTYADIAKQVLAKDRSPSRVNVYEIMAKPVISVPANMDIRYCARLFENFGISSAPVIEEGAVLGIVSYAELVLKGLWPTVEQNRR